MHQDAGAAQQTCQGSAAVDLGGPVFQLLERIPVEQPDKPEQHDEPHDAGFCKKLQVVIMRFVDVEVRIERTELRIDNREGSQSPAQDGPFQGHAERVFVETGASAARELGAGFGAETGKPVDELAAANPDEQADDEDEKNSDTGRDPRPRCIRNSSEPRKTNWTMTSNIPPREPERKIVPTIKAATAMATVRILPSVKRVKLMTSGMGRSSSMSPA